MRAADFDELTPVEAAALARAGELDSGMLAERLAATADDIASGARGNAGDLRDLAALALELARRYDTADADFA